MCSRNVTFSIIHPVCLCSGLAARWSAVGRRLAAEAGERVPSALSCLYKTAVRLRPRTLACVSYPLSIDFPPFVLSGARVLPRVRLVNFHEFFLCLKREARILERRYIGSWFVSWPIVFVHSNIKCCETVFHLLFIAVASNLRNVSVFKLLLRYIWRNVAVGKNRGDKITKWFVIVYSKGEIKFWNKGYACILKIYTPNLLTFNDYKFAQLFVNLEENWERNWINIFPSILFPGS